MFGRSAFLWAVAQFLLSLAKDELDNPALKAKVKKFVEDYVPGTWADAVAWGIVNAVWETLLAYAKLHAGNTSVQSVASAVEACRGEACEYLEKAA